MFVWVLSCLVAFCVGDSDLWVKRGLPDLEWMTYSDAQEGAKSNGKLVMVLFTRSWSEESTLFKEQLRASGRFVEVAKNFNLVNVEEPDEQMPEYSFFCIDGDYIPRVYFVDRHGQILEDFHPPRLELQFLYENVDDLIKQMATVYAHSQQSDEHAQKSEL
eukprot:TRINITY_DN679_c0_g1_i1.p1 TRINITY_DN679_c0_g1~~TRINITY_DN679_c0_g1_i1.p1  ORF type:complete len:171 (-),score=35.02 TRINITY_DN679_c0_g1_i1:135-617(-)